MRKKSNAKRAGIIALLAVLALAGAYISYGSQPASVGPMSLTVQLQNADGSLYKPSFLSGSFLPFFILKATDGTDISNKNMNLTLNSAINAIPSNATITQWSISGSVVITTDGRTFQTIPVQQSAKGAPKNPMLVSWTTAPGFLSYSIPLSTFANFWGTSYGTKTISFTGNAQLQVTFADGSVSNPVYNNVNLGSMTFNYLNGSSSNVPAIIGTAEPYSVVRVYTTSSPTPIATTIADASGNWLAMPSSLAVGTYSIYSTATDAAGNKSPNSTAITVSISTTNTGTQWISSIMSKADPYMSRTSMQFVL